MQTSIRSYAPGRVELLGNHTDYNQGVVLAAAIDYGVEVTGRTLGEGRLVMHALDLGTSYETLVDLLAKSDAASWANYVMGVVAELRALGHETGGAEISIRSTLPMGSGLSSSAALEVATAMFFRRACGLDLEPIEIARLCRRAENRFVGVHCGLLDQAASVFGKAGHAVYLDCRDESVKLAPFPDDVGLLICPSGVQHELTGGEYNERREQCFAAASALGVPALRDVTMSELVAARDRLPDLVYRRARHIVGENERVFAGVEALCHGMVGEFGGLMFESHRSSKENFENSTLELDLLVDIASRTDGVLGSRLTGGGFGGATVSLVHADRLAKAADAIRRSYLDATGHQIQPMVCSIADGAEIFRFD